ncbi:MAG: alpha/beta hydrolase-fold protein [Chloroflexia bacterium]
MTTGTIRIESRALKGPTTYSIIVPDEDKAGPGPYPVLLQLHGRYDDYRAWLDKSRLWSYVERIPIIVVMPSGGNSWWSNISPQGTDDPAYALNYEDYLVHDLWMHVNSTFPVRADARWALGGLSMGGFGAIRLGLKYPDRFCSIFAHSSVIPTAENLEYWLPLISPAARADLDCYRWAATRTSADLPRLGFDCGVDDYLIDDNRRFHTHLDRLGLPHTYSEHAGGHTWDYWDLHVREALVQHCEVLGIAPLPVALPPSADVA